MNTPTADTVTATSSTITPDSVLVLTSVAVVAGVAGAAIRIFLLGEPFFIIATVIGALAPVILTIAALVLLRSFYPRAHARVRLIPALVTLGVTAQCVGIVAFARSWNEADDVPATASPELAIVTSVFFALSLLFFAAAIAAAVTAAITLAKGTQLRRRQRVLLAVAASVPGCVALFALTVFPPIVSLGAGAAVLFMLIGRMQPRIAGTPVTRVQAPRRFALALIGFAVVSLAWAVAAAIGFSNSGEPIATTAMGWGSAVAQLGAIPLVLSTIVLSPSRRATGWHPAYIAVAGIVLSVAVQLLFGNPDAVAVFAGAAIVGVSLGLWIALAARPAMPAHPAAAATVVIGLMMHALTAWFGLVVANGGVAIAIVALVMMLGSRPGRRLIPLEGPSEPDGPAQPLSPATSAASG